MTTGTGEIAGAEAADAFRRDWQELRADGDIQFAPLELPTQPEPPGWFAAFLEFLSSVLAPIGEALGFLGHLIGVSGRYLTWLVIAVGVAILLYLAWRLLDPHMRRPRRSAEVSDHWMPDAEEASALLDEADRLAAEGRYDEATHLLLMRSVRQIAAARPGLLEPSSTAREITSLPALPEAARGAFGVIAERVERSLFALRSLSAEDWRAARSAYAEFALAAPRAA